MILGNELLDLTSVDVLARAYGASLAFRFDEPSGLVAVNHGTFGALQNGAYIAVTLAQAGKLGFCALYNGTTAMLTVPAGAYGNYVAYTVATLVKASALGGGSSGRLFDFSGANTLLAYNGGTSRDAVTTDAQSTPSATPWIPLNTWGWVFETYDDAGDRKIHVYTGQNSALATPALSVQTAAVGARIDMSGMTMYVGNRSDGARGFAGLYQRFYLFPSVLTPTQLLALTRWSGV